jgi:hypothetical protein
VVVVGLGNPVGDLAPQFAVLTQWRVLVPAQNVVAPEVPALPCLLPSAFPVPDAPIVSWTAKALAAPTLHLYFGLHLPISPQHWPMTLTLNDSVHDPVPFSPTFRPLEHLFIL